MVHSKEILKVEIKGIEKPYYLLKDDFTELEKGCVEDDPRVRFLSPFDNSIVLRDRTGALFNFNYSLEAYVPKHKRKYGYFCLPVLWCDQLVGRIDPKVDRQNQILIVNNLHLEEKELNYNRFFPALSRALSEFARFHNCEKIQLNEEIPAKIRREVLV